MKLNKRERVLMIVTGTAAVGALLYVFGLGDLVDQFSIQTSQLETAEKQYVESLQIMTKAPEIQKRFNDLGILPPKAGEKRPDLVFTEELVSLSRGMNTRPEPAVYEDIPGSEYQFITARLRADGDLESIVNLLKALETRGLLFREVELDVVRDQDTIHAIIRLARIAPVPEDVLQARQKERKSARPKKAEGYEF